ncbi:MAG: insulinase family protein, partial [Gemmatimonadota bacterium]|nr:insulinase family protein [Gemmatimonadota bacterium]
LWSQMIQAPAFDSAQVDVWRGREVERVLRRRDDLASMAYSRFNQIMFGDHPVGWEMGPDDLDPEDLSREKLRAVHEAIVCPDNLILGIVGDLDWTEAQELARGLTRGLPPCSGLLSEEPSPDLRTDPGVFVIHREAEQAVVVMAHVSGIRQDDSPEYFASRIGNSILGGTGLSSRLSRRIRTREGLAYGASSLWTVSPRRDGLIGAITRTKPESAVEATQLILAEMDSMALAPPTDGELHLAIDEIVNGFVFNFETPFQIVARAIAFRHQDLPEDWLDRYLDGVQAVTGTSVHDAFSKHLDPGRMTLLLVGDTTRFSRSPRELGVVTVLPDLPSSQRGSRRSPR